MKLLVALMISLTAAFAQAQTADISATTDLATKQKMLELKQKQIGAYQKGIGAIDRQMIILNYRWGATIGEWSHFKVRADIKDAKARREMLVLQIQSTQAEIEVLQAEIEIAKAGGVQ